ncbi:MAG: thiamine phosphate synthase [Sandaracinaceae bacterium]|nr:thiamine phosphate synthase [Sandaracinaceae bacterium]
MTEAAIPFDLYLITDPQTDVVAITRAALAAAPRGRIGVQVRHKGATARDLVELARALIPVCRAQDAPLLVNDRIDVAREVGADGAHLPERGLDAILAREILGADAIVGRSCHDRFGLARAAAEGASFATLGPLDAMHGKSPPIDAESFASMVCESKVAVFALGGVTPERVSGLRAAGARGVAVIRSIYAAPDPAGATRALIAALDAAPGAVPLARALARAQARRVE